ncbi:hypothetical protein L204_105969 [Cryptococcus depauperatus]
MVWYCYPAVTLTKLTGLLEQPFSRKNIYKDLRITKRDFIGLFSKQEILPEHFEPSNQNLSDNRKQRTCLLWSSGRWSIKIKRFPERNDPPKEKQGDKSNQAVQVAVDTCRPIQTLAGFSHASARLSFGNSAVLSCLVRIVYKSLYKATIINF